MKKKKRKASISRRGKGDKRVLTDEAKYGKL